MFSFPQIGLLLLTLNNLQVHELTCITAASQVQKYVVTGDAGEEAMLVVWDVEARFEDGVIFFRINSK